MCAAPELCFNLLCCCILLICLSYFYVCLLIKMCTQTHLGDVRPGSLSAPSCCCCCCCCSAVASHCCCKHVFAATLLLLSPANIIFTVYIGWAYNIHIVFVWHFYENIVFIIIAAPATSITTDLFLPLYRTGRRSATPRHPVVFVCTNYYERQFCQPHFSYIWLETGRFCYLIFGCFFGRLRSLYEFYN